MKENEDKRLSDYLLGNLPESEQVRLEEEYLADRSAQDRLLIVEDELVDAYLQGHFTPVEREYFETGFLASSRGRRKLGLARSLTALAAEPQRNNSQSIQARRSFWTVSSIRWSFATALLAIVLALVWFHWAKILRHSNPQDPQDTASQNPSGRQNQEKQQAPPHSVIPDKMPAPQESPSVSPAVPSVASVASILLNPSVRDMGQYPKITISLRTLQVQFRLALRTNHHTSYRVDLLDVNDSEKWNDHGLKPQVTASTNELVFKLPASLFDKGEYTFVVSPDQNSTSPIAEYPFLVHKE